MKKKLALALLLPVVLLFGCDAKTPEIDTAQYSDAPKEERLHEIVIYWAFNTGSYEESWTYVFSQEGIVEEGYSEVPNEQDIVLDENGQEMVQRPEEMPGGASNFFHGAAPGDVIITFTTTKGKKVLDETAYVVRVYDDLRLSILDTVDIVSRSESWKVENK
ncbi:hypothetical protein LJC49_04620 [Ruminococcaceae bacterium OttesenSCG-928-I18]|nr:hypothetical protein [Ruminococcaceae bacterium OttesenSCG-928-I18]